MSRAEAEEAAVARSMMRRRVMSIVEDQGVYDSSCGYCKSSSRTSVAQGIVPVAQSLLISFDAMVSMTTLFAFEIHVLHVMDVPITL
jgi:hypothetical protein